MIFGSGHAIDQGGFDLGDLNLAQAFQGGIAFRFAGGFTGDTGQQFYRRGVPNSAQGADSSQAGRFVFISPKYRRRCLNCSIFPRSRLGIVLAFS